MSVPAAVPCSFRLAFFMQDASPIEVGNGTIVASRPELAPAVPRPPGRPDYASMPIAARDLALIVVQLVLCTILVWQFELEAKRQLLMALLIASAGFVVNVRLRPAWRPAWFALVSAASVLAVLGWTDGLFALGLAGALLAAAALPLPYWPRVGVVLAIGGGLTWMRWQSTALFWPVVGSMFMFRMIAYLHALRHERAPRALPEIGSYFLMLPNAFFPLFPVVDAKVFRDTWYNDEPRVIYQTGLHWIATGLLHLFLYRVIKYEVLPSPLGVRTLPDVMLYLAANYALYLRVSGQFHMICGILHLFGWNVPRTHDNYFLASSFSDIWRRINIYWKDFLTKTFFYPAYFTLRAWPGFAGRRGDGTAIVLAVLWVFMWTWLAHSWQMFWRVGRFPFEAADAWMWLVVGGLVAGNSLLDYRSAYLRRPNEELTSVAAAVMRSLQIMAMFLIVSLFWARWTNVETFRYVVYVGTSQIPSRADVLTLAGWGLAVFAGLTCVALWRREGHGRGKTSIRINFDRQAALQTAVLAIIVVLAAPGGVADSLGTTGQWVRRLQSEHATAAESMAVIDGYYEQLNDANPARLYHDDGDLEPNQIAIDFADMIRRRNDVLELELIPGWKGSWNAKPISINRWGMRDRERTLVAEPGVRRIAAVGSSLVMGFGVGDNETFVALFEKKLNEAASVSESQIEVLNFGVGRYSPLHRRAEIDHKVLAFRPDLVLYFAHEDEIYTSARRLAELAYHHVNLEDDVMQSYIESIGIPVDASEATYQIELEKRHAEILALIYRRIRKSLDVAGIPLVYVYMPIPGDHNLPFDPRVVIKFATDAGFPVVDLTDWWEDRSVLEMVLGLRDHHPTPLGHEFVAKHLFLKRDEILGYLK